MARTADKTDSYISMVLGLNGRVRPADLQSLRAEDRLPALRTFLAAHESEMQLYLAGDELVAGQAPAASQPSAAGQAPAADAPATALGQTPESASLEPAPAPSAQPTDLTPDGVSAVDLLLGDYDGVPAASAEHELVAERVRVFAAPAAGDPAAQEPSLTAAPAQSATPGSTDDSPAGPATPSAPKRGPRMWMLWWIPTLLIPLFGGGAAWFVLRHKRESAARAMLATALVFGLLASVAWLRYAEQIAAVRAQRASQSVIVLPGK